MVLTECYACGDTVVCDDAHAWRDEENHWYCRPCDEFMFEETQANQERLLEELNGSVPDLTIAS